MTIYKVTRGSSYNNNEEEIFFTSRDKAIGYIIGRYAESREKPRGRERRPDWWNGSFCYTAEKLFSLRNWNKYLYLINCGFFYIDAINVL